MYPKSRPVRISKNSIALEVVTTTKKVSPLIAMSLPTSPILKLGFAIAVKSLITLKFNKFNFVTVELLYPHKPSQSTKAKFDAVVSGGFAEVPLSSLQEESKRIANTNEITIFVFILNSNIQEIGKLCKTKLKLGLQLAT
jgi:hypothetical protein